MVCGCFLKFGLPALGKTSEYSLLMLVRRVVQSDFSIFVRKGGENSGNVRLHTNKKLYKNTRKHYTQFRSIRDLEKILLLTTAFEARRSVAR